MLTNDEKRELQKLLAKAQVSVEGNVLIVDDVKFQIKTVAPVGGDATPVYGSNGWATNVATDIGGLRSKLVDATIQEAINAGFPEAAAKVPKYHIAHFWSAPSTSFGWSRPDPVRFSMPTDAQQANIGLSQAQLEQIQDNLIALDNWTMPLSMGADGSKNYRGEKGKSGFAPVNTATGQVDFSPANPPGYQPNKLDTAFPQQLVAAKYVREYPKDQNGNEVRNTWTRKMVEEHPEQYIYDSHWDTQTDVNVNRYWRNWLAAQGVPLKPEA